MAQDATNLSRKRAQPAEDVEPSVVASSKRVKVDDDAHSATSATSSLNAITSAVSGFFGYGSQSSTTVNGTDQKSAAASLPPTEQAHPSNSPIATAASPASPRPPNPLFHNPTSPSPVKFRPAIKLAALRGSKWDDGTIMLPQRKTTPKKPTPAKKTSASPAARNTPSKATPGRPAGSPLKKGTAADEYDADHADELLGDRPSNGVSSVGKTAGAKRLFASSDSTTPKGILTPKKKRGRPAKNVKFGSRLDDEVVFEDVRKPGRPKKVAKAADVEEETGGDIVCGICSKGHSKAPNEIILCDNCDYAVHQECYEVPEIPTGEWLCKSCAQEDILKTPKPVEESKEIIAKAVDVPDIPNLDQHVRSLQRVLLDRCTGHRPVCMFGQHEAQDKARQLVEQTVLAGEGNSMLLIGARGSGKTTVSPLCIVSRTLLMYYSLLIIFSRICLKSIAKISILYD